MPLEAATLPLLPAHCLHSLAFVNLKQIDISSCIFGKIKELPSGTWERRASPEIRAEESSFIEERESLEGLLSTERPLEETGSRKSRGFSLAEP